MELIECPIKNKKVILALGAESAGVFAVYRNDKMFVSENFGDLLDDSNFLKYKKNILGYLKKENIKLDIILSDLHPLYKTTFLGEELAEKFKVKHIKIQHHIAHIFSAIVDYICHPEFILGSENYRFRNKFGMTENCKLPNNFFGIAMDGTGYGLDGNVWGSEIFKIRNTKYEIRNKSQIQKTKISNLEVERIGSLEEQIMIGGDLAVKEPARMVISILAKFMPKENIYEYVKKYYSKNEFEALYNQMNQNFNCQITTSTGRILDAVSVLLEFAGNERNFKHEAAKKLEENSSKPYKIESRIKNQESREILDTTYLFEYLIKNIKKDKRRLAATAQLYIAKGFCKLIKNYDSCFMTHNSCILAAGGISNNKIISEYLESQGVYLSKKIPRGDEGIAVGQIVYYAIIMQYFLDNL